MRLVRTCNLCLATALIAWAAPGAARADTIVQFTYLGTGAGQATTTGTGSIVFTSGLTTVGLSDVKDFSLQLASTDLDAESGLLATLHYVFGLANLTSLTATVGAGPVLESLTLTTGFVNTSEGGPTFPHAFEVNSLAVGGAVELYDAGPVGGIGTATTGTVTITSIVDTAAVPEPLSATLIGLGATAMLLFARRRSPRA